jgi:hypothetical protein
VSVDILDQFGRPQATEPPSSDLESQLTHATQHYRSAWEAIDTELYGLCRRHPSHRNPTDVYVKLTVIDRVYRAGLARAWKGSRDPETAAAEILTEHADLIVPSLGELQDCPLDRDTVGEIIRLHGALTRALQPSAGDRWLTSFVSKYLHFHCPITPIYDSRSASTINDFVDGAAAKRIRAGVPVPPGRILPYYRFATKFLALQERLAIDTELRPTVKEIDHLLLGVSSSLASEPSA